MVVVVVLDTLPTLHPVAACAGRQCHCQAGQWPNSSLKQVEGVVCVCVCDQKGNNVSTRACCSERFMPNIHCESQQHSQVVLVHKLYKCCA